MAIDLQERPPFPRVLDNTMLADFAMCPRSFQWRFLYDLVVQGVSIHLHAGSVVALGLETIRKLVYTGTSLEDALCAAFRVMATAWQSVETDTVKNFENCVSAVDWYFETYPPLTDHIQPVMLQGKPAVEWNFILPIDVPHPETGDPLLLCGRFDELGVMGENTHVILDEKTCQQLGSKWSNKWKLRSQFTTYTWGANAFDQHIDKTVVRAICFRANGTFDTAEAIVFRPPWHVAMWHQQMLRNARRMVAAYKENYFDMNLGETCTLYGGCPFQVLCGSDTPENWLSSFKVRKWDPTIRVLADKNANLTETGEET